MPVPKDSHSVNRAEDALRRLNITPEALALAPEITPLLKKADGGLKAVIMAMRLSKDEGIRTFLSAYDSIPSGDRERLPMEAIALAAGVELTHLLGSIMIALQQQAVNEVKIIAMTSHPKITAARVRFGLRQAGERDRTALDTAMGFLPSPKGPTFIGKAIFGSGKGAEADEDSPALGSGSSDTPDLDRLFPPANMMQEKLTAIRQRLLPPSKN